MCQLLGVSSSSPTSSTLLLRPFYDRGGGTDCHSHGWGLALLRNGGIWEIYNETHAAATSVKAKEIISSANTGNLVAKSMISHIRYATMGEVCLENVHPFRRQLFGLEFVFAHNGDVDVSKLKTTTSTNMLSGPFQPLGGTDSEYFFCLILNHLHDRFSTDLPTLEDLYYAIEEICLDVCCQQQDGIILNFLLGFGEVLFGFSWPGKRPGGHVWNSLHYALKQDDDNHAAIISTKPITEAVDGWIEFQKGNLLLFVNGRLITKTEHMAQIDLYDSSRSASTFERRPSI